MSFLHPLRHITATLRHITALLRAINERTYRMDNTLDDVATLGGTINDKIAGLEDKLSKLPGEIQTAITNALNSGPATRLSPEQQAKVNAVFALLQTADATVDKATADEAAAETAVAPVAPPAV